MTIPDLRIRRIQPELMDDPELDGDLHRQALRALRRVNRVSGTGGRIWRAVRECRGGPPDTVRILDVACGGGDVLVDLGRRAARAGVAVDLHGCDRSATALSSAESAAERAGVSVSLHRLDVLKDSLPEGFDLVTSTLFLHHLQGDEVVALLARMRGVARTGAVQDLLRSSAGYLLAWTGLRILSRSRVAWTDGPRSVEAGFSLAEARSLAQEAGLPSPRIRRVWPERFLLKWSGA